MVECGVLKFGEFTLKSGRKSPFFMNAGGYVTGRGSFNGGERVTLTAVAEKGYKFDEWLDSEGKTALMADEASSESSNAL